MGVSFVHGGRGVGQGWVAFSADVGRPNVLNEYMTEEVFTLFIVPVNCSLTGYVLGAMSVAVYHV